MATVYVGTWESSTAVSSNATGLTVRNVLAIWPAAPKRSNACRGLVETYPLYAVGVTDPGFGAGRACQVYNCTLRMDRIMAQNSSGNSLVPTLFSTENPYDDSDASGTPLPFTAVSEANNVSHFPNLIAYPNTVTVNPEHILFAPLSEKCYGPRAAWGGVTRQPAFWIRNMRPRQVRSWIQSPCPDRRRLDAALTGNVSYMDITMQKRPEPPSKGAWEAD